MKIISSADLIRSTLIKPTTIKDDDRPAPRYVNADSEERYFSFYKTQKDLEQIEDFCDQIIFLTNEKYEYEQANIHFINPKLPEYSEQCTKKIEQLQHIRRLKEELQVVKEEKCNYNKLQFNGNVNQLVDVFYQLSRELFVNGRSYLDGNVNDIAKMIAHSFVDKDGNDLSMDTIKTILTPSREEKRPNNAKRIDVDKLL